VNENSPSGVFTPVVSAIWSRSLSCSTLVTSGVRLSDVEQDVQRGVRLRRELIGVGVVLGFVRGDEVLVLGGWVAEVPGGTGDRALGGRTGRGDDRRRVEAVATDHEHAWLALVDLFEHQDRGAGQRAVDDRVG